MMSRATRNKIVTYFQSRGAKVHFNYGLKFTTGEEGSSASRSDVTVDVRYGVIGYDDLVRDLRHWETMMVSQMMQRPINTIV